MSMLSRSDISFDIVLHVLLFLYKCVFAYVIRIVDLSFILLHLYVNKSWKLNRINMSALWILFNRAIYQNYF